MAPKKRNKADNQNRFLTRSHVGSLCEYWRPVV